MDPSVRQMNWNEVYSTLSFSVFTVFCIGYIIFLFAKYCKLFRREVDLEENNPMPCSISACPYQNIAGCPACEHQINTQDPPPNYSVALTMPSPLEISTTPPPAYSSLNFMPNNKLVLESLVIPNVTANEDLPVISHV